MKKWFKKIKERIATNNFEILGVALVIVCCIIIAAIGIVLLAKFI